MIRFLFITLLVAFFISSCSKTENKLARKKTSKSALTVMRTNDCFVCHSIEDYTGVPSYRMIAERYGTDEQTIRNLSEKVLEGGGGVWGNVQMVKHPLLKAKDVRNIVRWVLSLDADSVLTDLKPENSSIYDDTTHRFRIDIYEGEEKVFSGSMDEITLVGNNRIKKDQRVVITGSLSIHSAGKHFFYLRKTGTGKMTKEGNMVISDREEDQEIMLDLDPGDYPFQIDYTAKSNEDTLSLFWLPEGKEYYEVMSQ
ncbi:MAG: c-type cytochrome [Bacteroidota bacterium]